MKKILIVVLLLFFIVGCTPVKDLEELDIIQRAVSTDLGMYNQYRTGYKYYLPRGLIVTDKKDFNEIIRGEMYNYYLYIDVVSYYNKVKQPYKVDEKAVFSESFTYKEMDGYLEINSTNEKYLIEIMYNYAKIEVIVKEADIKIAVSNAIGILSSIKYNDSILENLMGDNILKFNEIEFNIFKTKKDGESNYLTAVEDYGQYEETEHDSDVIN